MSHPPSAFKTPKGEAAYLAAYDAAMKLWPVPYEEMHIPFLCDKSIILLGGLPATGLLTLISCLSVCSLRWRRVVGHGCTLQIWSGWRSEICQGQIGRASCRERV